MIQSGDAIQKELNALETLGVWKFYRQGHIMPNDYQKAPLRMIFDVKKEHLRLKSRFVVGGHKMDSTHHEAYSSVAQTMSLRILLTMAQKHGLKIMSGDVSNAFPHAHAMDKSCTVAGEEFAERQGCAFELARSLYGMTTASRSWSLCFGDFMHSLGYAPKRADPDMWIKREDGVSAREHQFMCQNNQQPPNQSNPNLSENSGDNYCGYSCISTHVDDFLIISNGPEPII